jgi:Domain of unknown function (DUF5063)
MEEAKNFGLLAAGYCAFVETSDDLDRDRFLRELEAHLVALYGAAIDLPFGGVDEPDAPSSMTSGEWQTLYRRLSEKLGDTNDYRLMFDPYEDEMPVVASLADDIADIYRDLKDGFALLNAGGSRDGAVWEWRHGFDHHWGRHAAHALYAVYVLTHA